VNGPTKGVIVDGRWTPDKLANAHLLELGALERQTPQAFGEFAPGRGNQYRPVKLWTAPTLANEVDAKKRR
jgi:hypothetical protein